MGTRPDAVKLAPVARAFERSEALDAVVAVTAQHRELLDQVLSVFDIRPGFDLDLMQAGQPLAGFAARALQSLADLYEEVRPDCVVVQGDTTTAMVGALAAHYAGCSIVHVEAGLRSFDLRNPFPEEANRRIVSQIADLHFAPTGTGKHNLLTEGVNEDRIHVTGNTVIDALLHVVPRATVDRLPSGLRASLEEGRRLVLVTLHRRESFGGPLTAICGALRRLVERDQSLNLLFPVHPNPRVREAVYGELDGLDRVFLVEPMSYVDFIAAMKASYFIITDSGGVQEEAPTLERPILVLRDATERPEVVAVGAAKLIGRDPGAVEAAAWELLTSVEAYQRMRGHKNPYGDGHASMRIAEAVEAYLAS